LANPTAPPRTASWPCAMLEIGGLFGIIGAVGVLFAPIA
jgi:hypothetical protein